MFLQTRLSLVVMLAAIGAMAGIVRADSTTVLSNLVIPPSPEDNSTIDQRLAQRKTVYKSQLPAAANSDIASKCVLAQAALTDARATDNKAAAIRTQAYQDLAKRLSYMVDNLSSQGVDATALLGAQNKFVSAINNYLVDAENYKTAMDDAINVECKNDPSGFKASVFDARKYRQQLSIEAYEVKNNLTGLRQALSDERQLLIKNPGKLSQGTVGTKAN